MKLFINKSDDNVVEKNLLDVYDFDIRMKRDVDVVSPIIILNDEQLNDLHKCNYCYLSHFDRYYFIRSTQRLNSYEIELHLECDVLYTYRHEIMNSKLLMRKKIENEFHSSDLRHKDIQTIERYYSDTELEENDNMVVITTIGGYLHE